MSSFAQKAPLKLKTELDPDMKTEEVERYVQVGGHNVKRKAKIPRIQDEVDPEHPLHVYLEFIDACSNNRLHLTTGPLKFEFFRLLLKGNARTQWDDAVVRVAGTTLAHF